MDDRKEEAVPFLILDPITKSKIIFFTNLSVYTNRTR